MCELKINDEMRQLIKEKIDCEVSEAFKFAESSSFPQEKTAYEGIYAKDNLKIEPQ